MTAHSRCPLCSGFPEYMEYGCGDGETDCICCTCGLCTRAHSLPNGEEDCWREWEDLVGKFPPFMRVQTGDKIRYDAGDEELDGIVVGIKRDEHNERMKLVVPMGSASKESVVAWPIIKWPWELEGGKA